MPISSITPPQKYRFHLKIVPGNLQALLGVSPAEDGVELNRHNIINHLKSQGIIFGILEDNIEQLISLSSHTPMLIAQGRDAKMGRDAYFKNLIPKDKMTYQQLIHDEYQFITITPEMLEEAYISSGTPLVQKVPAAKGAPGCDIFGNIVMGKDGKDCPWPKYKNCHVSQEHPLILMSSQKGIPIVHLPQSISIEPVTYYRREIQSSQRHNGITLIFGNILKHSRIFSASDIIVFGTIDSSFLCSEYGSIIVLGGVKGKGQAILKAQQSIYLDFVENATLEAQGSIFAKSALQSHLIALEHIQAQTLLSSECWSRTISAHKVGQESTLICGDPNYIKMEITKNNQRIDQVFRGLNHYLKEQSKAVSDIYYFHIQIRLSELKQRQQLLLDIKEKLEQKLQKSSHPTIDIEQHIDTDCSLSIMDFEKVLKQGMTGPLRFYAGKYGILSEHQKEDKHASHRS